MALSESLGRLRFPIRNPWPYLIFSRFARFDTIHERDRHPAIFKPDAERLQEPRYAASGCIARLL